MGFLSIHLSSYAPSIFLFLSLCGGYVFRVSYSIYDIWVPFSLAQAECLLLYKVFSSTPQPYQHYFLSSNHVVICSLTYNKTLLVCSPVLEKVRLVAGTLKILSKIFRENPHFSPRKLIWLKNKT